MRPKEAADEPSRSAAPFAPGSEMARRLSHVIAFDDAPFGRDHRGDVPIVGAVFAATRLHGIVAARVRRDGRNATTAIAAAIERSRFRPHLQAILLDGIALAGFNVVDLGALALRTRLPVLAVARRRPDLDAIRRALTKHVAGGARKWRLIEAAGPMENVGSVWVQRAGLSVAEARSMVARLTIDGSLPEPLRVAHIVAGALHSGESRGRP